MTDLDLVVFDMDGVLVDLDRPRRLDLLATMTGHTPDAIEARIFASDFERSAEAGVPPTGDAYLAEFNRRLGTDLGRDEWVRARREAMTVDRRVLAIAERVAAQVPIALLTNNGALLQESLAELAPEIAVRFGEAAHTSSRFGARKPDPVVFQRVAAHHGARPVATVFIDDDPDSVAGAERAGLIGVHFTSPAELADALTGLGLDVAGPVADAPPPT